MSLQLQEQTQQALLTIQHVNTTTDPKSGLPLEHHRYIDTSSWKEAYEENTAAYAFIASCHPTSIHTEVLTGGKMRIWFVVPACQQDHQREEGRHV